QQIHHGFPLRDVHPLSERIGTLGDKHVALFPGNYPLDLRIPLFDLPGNVETLFHRGLQAKNAREGLETSLARREKYFMLPVGGVHNSSARRRMADSIYRGVPFQKLPVL